MPLLGRYPLGPTKMSIFGLYSMEKSSYEVGLGVGFVGVVGSVWVMGEWAVGHWIVGVTSFQKIYGLYGLKHHTVDLLSCRFLAPTNGRTNERR